jgi:drug/metabolite transporter (DMT)-like permease
MRDKSSATDPLAKALPDLQYALVAARIDDIRRDMVRVRRPRRRRQPETAGLGLAGLGVLAFSMSMPATVLALDGLDPYLVGIGRAAAATVLAVLALLAARARLPRRDQLPGLAAAGLGVVFGFPVLSTLALHSGASASHGAVVVGLLPAATALLAVLRAGERPQRAFWPACAAGALCVSGFALIRGAGRFTGADLLLFGALLAAALGYAEGGRLSREMPGWQVISWALVLTGPISLPVTAVLLTTTHPYWTGRALVGFGYVSAVSMFLGFFAWYAGLGRAGIAKGGQLQLAQPPLTLVWSALFLGEHLDPGTGAAALAVLVCVAWTQRTRRTASPQLNTRLETARP